MAEKLNTWDLAVIVDEADGHVWTDADWSSFADSGGHL